MLITRRALVAAAGTLASAAAPRKPRAAEALRSIDALKPTDPPKPPPAIAFLAADGAQRTLADYAGQGVILNLWATWCVPCVAEMPALAGLAEAVKGDRIAVLPLSSDRGGAPVVQRFYDRYGIRDLPVLLDPELKAVHALGARGIPTTLVIDRQGREQGRIEGAVDWTAEKSVAVIRKLVG